MNTHIYFYAELAEGLDHRSFSFKWQKLPQYCLSKKQELVQGHVMELQHQTVSQASQGPETGGWKALESHTTLLTCLEVVQSPSQFSVCFHAFYPVSLLCCHVFMDRQGYHLVPELTNLQFTYLVEIDKQPQLPILQTGKRKFDPC